MATSTHSLMLTTRRISRGSHRVEACPSDTQVALEDSYCHLYPVYMEINIHIFYAECDDGLKSKV